MLHYDPTPQLPVGVHHARVAHVRAWVLPAGRGRAVDVEVWTLQLVAADAGGHDPRHPDARVVGYADLEYSVRGRMHARRALQALGLQAVRIEPCDLIGRTAVVTTVAVEYTAANRSTLVRHEVDPRSWAPAPHLFPTTTNPC